MMEERLRRSFVRRCSPKGAAGRRLTMGRTLRPRDRLVVWVW